ncbi:sodium:solute symporter family transporter [Pedobacter nyackensis]|uniref:Solute:Na+ symporter, SSS family n=1 Tax=Pedobacter nyackensis TaxID=475255 RepID=A0A1W2CQ29_9SPHI|nr:sodium/solute symporter [Pedobacter nyackensis]SMC87323.1 solute:Na+ symporter, SSS family [Pedobacter nyackensis]
MDISFDYFDYIVLGTYILVLLIIGFFMNKKGPAGEDIFLGGRSLKWWQIGFSMFSANAGPMMLIGFAGIGFSHGMVGANFEWLAWIFLLMLSVIFLPYYLKSGISTIPQFLLIRFGKRSYTFLIAYSLVSVLVVWLGSALYAGGLLISSIFGVSIYLPIIIIAAIATSFTATGGLKAVVRTSIFQSLIIIVSSVFLVFLGLKEIGGLDAFIAKTPKNYWKLFLPSDNVEYSWIAIVLGYPVAAIYYWCADQTIVQKVLAAQDLKQGQYGTVFIAVLKIIMPVIFIIPGIMCYVLFRESARADNAYIVMVTKLMPHGLLGLAVAALIAALIDTVSSSLNSFCTVFTLDLVPLFKEQDKAQQIRMGKWITVGAAVFGVLVAIGFANSGKNFFELTQGLVSIFAPPLSVVFLAGISWKRINAISVESVLYGGGTLCTIIGACNVFNYPYEGFWPHFLMLSFYLFLFLGIVIVLITLFSAKKEDKLTDRTMILSELRLHKNKNLRVVWGLLAVIMVLLYVFFN